MSNENKHSILPPSGAHAWVKCPMWVTMNVRNPKPQSSASAEGTAAHWVFEQMHAGAVISEGMTAPNDQIVTDEMIEGAHLMIQTLEARGMFEPIIEKQLSIPSIHPECFGTPDAYQWVGDTLEVVDYKFGHKFVDEVNNMQGVAYIAGILADSFPPTERLNFTIVQPRCFGKGSPVRTWSVSYDKFAELVSELRAAALKALEPNPTANTGSHCEYCPGRHSCTALQQAAYNDAEFSTQSEPLEMTAEAASLELRILERALERLTARVEGLREIVIDNIKRGYRTPYHKLSQGFGRQDWNISPEQVIIIGELLGVKLSKTAVITPKQALKLAIDEAVIKRYTTTPLGATKLVPDNPADASRVFGIN